MPLEEKISEIIEGAKRFNHRRIFVVYGSRKPEVASMIIKQGSYSKVLYASHSLEIEETGVEHYERFKKSYGREFDAIIFPETEKVLGTTYDAIVLDLTKQLVPNDIGILVEVVSGGGAIVFISPRPEEWPEIRTFFQKKLVVHPYKLDDIKPRFLKRFVRKLKEHSGICFVDSDKSSLSYRKPKEKETKVSEIVLPSDFKFDEKLYRLCKTQEQVEVVKQFEEFVKPDKKTVYVLTANRGRGKSAAIGIALAGVINKSKKKKRIVVTAPQFSNVKTLFDFLLSSLDLLGIKYKLEKYGDIISGVYSKRFSVEFWEVNKATERKADLLVVDEAAGIPVPILFKLLKVAKVVVYSSTIHGYEGAGRGFSVRFLKNLKEIKTIRILQQTMQTPIRYAPNDPVEKWLYDTLLLDAEPPSLTHSDKTKAKKHEVRYIKPNLDRWFGKEEKKLRDFFGIYVLAHYKNRPNDLALIGEAPHHHVRSLELRNGKVVCALQFAEEGSFTSSMIQELLEGKEPQGNIIPDRLVKHYRIGAFARLKGIRIVRIATHPSLFGHGLGSLMLKKLETEFKATKDWIGASFGASYELLKFWFKNGYQVVHVTPDRNPVSGEYSCIVIKPFNEKTSELIEVMKEEFRLRFLNSLADTYRDMEPEIAQLMLKEPLKRNFEFKLTKAQQERLKMYLRGPVDYEACDDVIREVVKAYFMSSKPKQLTDLQERILVAKVLQGKKWEDVAKELNVGPKFCVIEVREIMRKLLEDWYDSN